MTTIEWTKPPGYKGETWNPLVGCSKISAGCKNCYAITQSYRNGKIAQSFVEQGKNPGRLRYYEGLTEKRGNRIEWTETVRFVPEALEIPLQTKAPTTWFVNSMSDLFHAVVSDEILDKVMAVMALTPQHRYLVLTKRPERMLNYFSGLRKLRLAATIVHLGAEYDVQNNRYYELIASLRDRGGDCLPLPNVWLGATVENQKASERASLLRQVPATVRFLSVEPMLEPIELDLEGIDWVICGGESGHQARPFNLDWARSLRDQCKSAGVAFFMKQAGSNAFHTESRFGALERFKATGKGNKLEDLPEDLRIREYPLSSELQKPGVE